MQLISPVHVLNYHFMNCIFFHPSPNPLCYLPLINFLWHLTPKRVLWDKFYTAISVLVRCRQRLKYAIFLSCPTLLLKIACIFLQLLMLDWIMYQFANTNIIFVYEWTSTGVLDHCTLFLRHTLCFRTISLTPAVFLSGTDISCFPARTNFWEIKRKISRSRGHFKLFN